MQASSADNAIAELSAKAVDLVLRHNVHPEKISQAISRGLREEAESLPRLEVLYNDTYGGFEYSEEFDKFLTATMQQWSSDQMLKTPPHMSPYMTAGQDDTRINDCACIRPFGKQQAEKFPVAFRPVSLYHALELDKYQDAMATIRYSSDAVEVQKATKACDHLPKGLLMAYHAQTSQRRPAGNRTRDIDDLQFCEAIAKHGENSEKIWRAQKHLCRDVMLSLHAWKGNGSLGHQEGHLAAAWKTFGLMCASGSYCQLSIAEVPQIVDWGVHEYDGKERVYVK